MKTTKYLSIFKYASRLVDLIPFGNKYWKWMRLGIFMLIDIFVITFCYWFAFVLRLESVNFGPLREAFFLNLPLVVGSLLFSFYLLGMYRQVWRYANFSSALLIGKCVSLGVLIFVASAYLIGWAPVPRSVPAIFLILLAIAEVATKFLWRILVNINMAGTRSNQRRCLVYGAGMAGELFARHALSNPNFPYKAVGFIDDDLNKKNRLIHGVKIYGSGRDLNEISKAMNVDAVIIALHNAPGEVIRDIVHQCRQIGLETLIMPDMANAIGNELIQLRSVDVKDLLRRAPKDTDLELIKSTLRNRRVLVTGAGGSIGSELCRQILSFGPRQLILLDASEFNLYQIERELQESGRSSVTEIIPILGNTSVSRVVDNVFSQYKPEYVLHAAAYKHVPLVEANPIEGILNNIQSTFLVCEAAKKYGASGLTLISSDKAVNPVGIMGASKRICELVVQSMQDDISETRFSMVRFGNVLGSSGSVIPNFLRQIKDGGPVTVTHPDMNRYFMLTNEAVSLVLQSLAMAKGGEVFILNMGEPVNIREMAEQLILLSGKKPGEDIEIKYIGLRPGEKLFEELILNGSEKHTQHDDIFIAVPFRIKGEVLSEAVKIVLSLANNQQTEDCIRMVKYLATDRFISSANDGSFWEDISEFVQEGDLH
jgi:FlaA1/EpsC-like NDP-sugar epimerase